MPEAGSDPSRPPALRRQEAVRSPRLLPGAAKIQRAPFNVQDVEQVTLLPRSHLMQTATH
jgi:hypothetical protein